MNKRVIVVCVLFCLWAACQAGAARFDVLEQIRKEWNSAKTTAMSTISKLKAKLLPDDYSKVPSNLKLHYVKYKFGLMGSIDVRVAVGEAQGQRPKADFIFVHGFADCCTNHGPLFQQLQAKGIRVISFDLPQHGGTKGGVANSINLWSFSDLGRLVGAVEKATRQDETRPLLLGGWSTGGLVVISLLQNSQLRQEVIKRNIVGSITIAPGISVRPLVGKLGVVTEETLTSNRHAPHFCKAKPISPFLVPAFAGKLLMQSVKSQREDLPSDMPHLIFVADETDDRYVKSENVLLYVRAQQRKSPPVPLAAIQCNKSKHEMDNEPDPIGSLVRSTFADAAEIFVSGGSGGPKSRVDQINTKSSHVCSKVM